MDKTIIITMYEVQNSYVVMFLLCDQLCIPRNIFKKSCFPVISSVAKCRSVNNCF
jgi:hypothetical protein